MRTLSVLTVFALGLLAGPTPADDAKKDKEKEPTGSYVRKAEQMELKMEFKKDKVLVFHVSAGDLGGCVMESKYTRDADGIYHAEVTSFEKKGDFPVTKDKGYKFTFKLAVKDKAVVLSDMTGEDIAEEQRKIVEGEYEKAAGD
jgi:hypothetical protein